jgi:hypothetical protein
MLQIAPAVLIAAAVTATQPVPLRRPLGADERRAAEAYLKDSLALTEALFDRGRKLGELLGALLQGQMTDTGPVRTGLKESLSFVDERIAHFKTKAAPKFPEMSRYRTVFMDYLAWERQFFVTWIGDSLKVLENPKLSSEEKKRLLIEGTNAQAAEEKVRTTRIDAAMAEVNAALKRR